MGCDVLTEKPLTTDENKCQAILDAEKKSNKNLIVGFNYRWSPYATKIKELLGRQIHWQTDSVDFHWYLNTYHGASYFRRWHGHMESSGSLWVHKATHHFDLLELVDQFRTRRSFCLWRFGILWKKWPFQRGQLQ